MTALQTARRLGLSEKAITAFSGTPQQFARHFATDDSEAPAGGTLPSAPLAVTALRDSADTAFIDWTAPTTGLPILSYEVTTTPVTTTQTFPDTGGTERTLDPFAYAAGTSYVFHLKCVNAAGKGPAGDSAGAIINP
ncbi:MAG: fibronectin type III domain-containing protein [Azonexus sp.]